MNQSCWNVWDDRGFLCNPDPLTTLPPITGVDSEAVEHVERLANDLPTLLDSRRLRPTLDLLPIYDFAVVSEVEDFRIVERLMQIYSYFASAYVWATHELAGHCIPAGVAIPLHQLAGMVERPPILPYAHYVLINWRRIDPKGEIGLGNIELIQRFLGTRDEAWFILVHVDIEARAAGALANIIPALTAAEHDDFPALTAALENMAHSIRAMLRTFQRMPEQCDSEVYYKEVRPYIFGFDNVLYEGVTVYGKQPQSFRGQTGAQSSIIPALVAALGLEHEQTGLTQHLTVMKAYMPKPHREFVERAHAAGIRAAVLRAHNPALTDAYNEALNELIKFRRLHLHYTTVYIFQKVENPVGTGGTMYCDWLSQLINESEKQLI